MGSGQKRFNQYNNAAPAVPKRKVPIVETRTPAYFDNIDVVPTTPQPYYYPNYYEEQPKQKAVPFYPTAIPDRKPIVIRTTTPRTTTATTRSTTTTTRSTTTTPTTTTTFKSRRRTVSPRSYPKYKRKLERKKESIQSLKQKVHSNNKEPKTYSYENVPRYHLEQLEPNQGNLLWGRI